MTTASRLALVGLLLVAMAPAAVAHGGHHRHAHYRGWHHYGYAPAVSDYYHHSRQLVGTR